MSTSTATRKSLYESMVARPVALFVLFLTLIVISVIAYTRVPLQLMPDGFSEPRIYAWIPTPGASAQENEELVARPVEEQLRTISGIELLRSRSERDSVEFMIAFSGVWTNPSDRVLGQAVGFDHYLLKPCEPKEVIRLMEPLRGTHSGSATA